MKQIGFLLLLLIAATTVHAQTKSIAYKSHSGSAANYAAAIKNDAALKYDAGFGLPSHRSYHFIKEVRYLKPNSAVLVSAVYQGDFMRIVDTVFVRNVYDTVVNDIIFNKLTSVDSLKIILESRYHFDNTFEDVKFIGFGKNTNKKKKVIAKKKKESALIVMETNEPNFPNEVDMAQGTIAISSFANSVPDSNLPNIGLSLLLKMIFFSAVVGWLAWKLYQPLYKHTV